MYWTRFTFLKMICLLATLAAFQLRGQETTSAPVADFIWVDSDPTGATVTYEGKEVGKTPTVVHNLGQGSHKLTFSMEGYQTLEKSFAVPNDGSQQTCTLDIQNGACLIASVPPGATVYHESVLMGRTPLMIPAGRLRSGEQKFTLAKIGYDGTTMAIEIADNEPNQLDVALIPTLGAIEVTMIPATGVLFVDGKEYGQLPPVEERSLISRKIPLLGFVPGKHKFCLRYAGQMSEELQVNVEPGKKAEVNLSYWYPDILVEFKKSDAIHAMKIKEDSDGSLVILDRSLKLHACKVDEIQDVLPIAAGDSANLAREERIRRKMLLQEKSHQDN